MTNTNIAIARSTPSRGVPVAWDVAIARVSMTLGSAGRSRSALLAVAQLPARPRVAADVDALVDRLCAAGGPVLADRADQPRGGAWRSGRPGTAPRSPRRRRVPARAGLSRRYVGT